MEFVLMALGSCIAMTAISLLRKRAPSVEALSVELDAEQAEGHPHVFTRITAKFRVRGKEIKEADVGWAVTQARARFCPVGAMLDKAVEIDYVWEVQATD